MFVVERVARCHRYLYLVESVRDGKTVRQRTIKALGRKEALVASGELDRLAASIARHDAASSCPTLTRGGLPLAALAVRCCSGGCGSGSGSARCWQRFWTGASSALRWNGRCSLARCIGCSSRARTATARTGWPIVVSRAPRIWRSIMAWLGEELGEKAQGALVARCVKDVIEEKLFARR